MHVSACEVNRSCENDRVSPPTDYRVRLLGVLHSVRILEWLRDDDLHPDHSGWQKRGHMKGLYCDADRLADAWRDDRLFILRDPERQDEVGDALARARRQGRGTALPVRHPDRQHQSHLRPPGLSRSGLRHDARAVHARICSGSWRHPPIRRDARGQPGLLEEVRLQAGAGCAADVRLDVLRTPAPRASRGGFAK